MLYFMSDYTEGAHPKVLQHLVQENMSHLPGYGEDPQTMAAKEKICRACGREDLQVGFLVGGTQTNQTAISTLLRPWEGVIAVDSGHINVHEAGAIEYSGHRVIALEAHEGKLKAEVLEKYMEAFHADETKEHLVQPGMVYISHPTELGTLYSKAELEALSACCHSYGLDLYMDGARLGYGLVSPGSDLELSDIARLCDLFYIGGTKVGALCGEALVYTRGNMPPHFTAAIKQHGALLAKMRLVSQQFDALFTDDLYFEISRHAVQLALKIKKAAVEKGYELLIDSPTNQQFVIFTREQAEKLRSQVACELWQPMPDGRQALRFVTSWATDPADVDELIELL